MANYYQYNPDYAIHPGEYLEEILETRNMKKQDFAERCGISVKTVSQILNQKALFSSDLAMHFEKVLGVDANILMNLNTQYQMYESRIKDKIDLESKEKWVKKFPQKELIKNNIIPEKENISDQANALLDFFNVSSPSVWEDYYVKKSVSFRKSAAFTSTLISTTTWVRIGEKIAEDIECAIFDKELFKGNLKKIRNLTTKDPEIFVPQMKELCCKSGVALVFVPELKNTHISGVTEWISSEKALIIMSLRYKSNDHFWFTFFHESGHIVLHKKKEVFIDTKDNSYSDYEIEANNFARKALINQTIYKNFLKKRSFYKEDIIKFSEDNNIAPGIIVGMLQYDKKIEFSWHNNLKRKYKLL